MKIIKKNKIVIGLFALISVNYAVAQTGSFGPGPSSSSVFIVGPTSSNTTKPVATTSSSQGAFGPGPSSSSVFIVGPTGSNVTTYQTKPLIVNTGELDNSTVAERKVIDDSIKKDVEYLGLQTSTTGGFQSIFHIVGRENDIFTFCKEGMPEHKWVAVDPKKGTFKITNYNCSKF